jgi:hypothetical protein
MMLLLIVPLATAHINIVYPHNNMGSSFPTASTTLFNVIIIAYSFPGLQVMVALATVLLSL